MNILGFNKEKMTVSKEIGAGLVTFLTMAYILAVNPTILSVTGMDKGAVFTATAVSAAVATLVMAFYAKLPFVLAPGMGLNAFFAYTVVMMLGYTWQFALTAVLIEGVIFILMTVFGVRSYLVDAMPKCILNAITPGIGMFIAFIGLQNGGIIVSNNATMVAMGNLTSPVVWLTILGFLLCCILTVCRVTGALLIGIATTTLIGAVMGVTHLGGIVNLPPDLSPIAFKFEWAHVMSGEMVICVLTLLFMDLFDTMGTLVGVCNCPAMLRPDGKMPDLNRAFMADAVGTTLGGLLGTSTVTVFAESASGVNAGGRSGLTALTAAVCFLLSLFFAPLFLSIPTQATAAVLIFVGFSMVMNISNVKMDDMLDCIPSMVCIMMMPLTYSISEGIILGVLSYVLINACSGRWRRVSLTMYLMAAAFLLKIIYL